MRVLGRVAALVGVGMAAAMVLCGCVTNGPAASDPRLQGTWHLASGSDHGLGLPIGGRAVSLTIGDAAHTGGKDPCSSYSANVTGGVGVVYIRAALTGGTRDECSTPTLTRLEQLYIGALSATRYAAINQGALVLTSPTSTLVFVRTSPAPVATIQNTSWTLYSILSQAPTVTIGHGTHAVSLKFDDVSELTLSSPCVTASGNYQIEGENFTISHVITAPGLAAGCGKGDRNLAAQAIELFDGPLLLDETSDGSGSIPMLVITNLDVNLPIVWRAEN